MALSDMIGKSINGIVCEGCIGSLSRQVSEALLDLEVQGRLTPGVKERAIQLASWSPGGCDDEYYSNLYAELVGDIAVLLEAA